MSNVTTSETERTIWDKARPATLKVVIGAVVAAGLIGAAAMIVGEFGLSHLRALLTVGVIVIFSLLVLYDAEVSSKRSHTFAFIGVIVSLYLLLAGILKIWIPALNYNTYDEYDLTNVGVIAPYYSTYDVMGDFAAWIWLLIIARFALIHAHLLINIHRKYSTPLLQLTAKVTMGLITLFAVLLSLPTIFESIDYTDGYWRFVGAVFILDVLGTVLIPLSYALFGPKVEEIPSVPRYAAPSTPAQPQHVAPVAAPAATQEELQNFYHGQPAEQTSTKTHGEASGLDSQTVAGAPVFVTPEPQPAAQHNPQSQNVPPRGSVKFEAPPAMSRKLAWPRYEDGIPLPILPDGTPDFSAVERY